MSSDERLARVESKVDSMQHELTEFKIEFSEHQKADDRNFSNLSEQAHQTQLTQVEIKTGMETRMDSSNKSLKIFGFVISLLSLITAVIVALK